MRWLVVLLALSLLPGVASAAGYQVPDLGTVARSRGGAFVADADDPTAMAYNPAGLAGQKQSLLVDLTLMRLSETFARNGADIPATTPASTAPLSNSNNPPPQIVPELIYVHPLSDKLSLAAGLHAPTGPRYQFDSAGSQRFSLTSLSLVEASYGVAVAYKVDPRLSVGLELEGLLHQVKQDFVVTNNTSTTQPSEAPQYDERLTLDVQSNFTPDAIVGVKWSATDHLELGASYRPGATIKCSGQLEDHNSGIPQAAVSQPVNFTFGIPAIGRVGARWVQPVWDLEGDLVYEGWSDHPREVITPSSGPTLANGTTQGAVERDFTDAWSVRVGGGYQASQTLKLLAGLYFETSAVPDSRLDAGTFDSNKEAVSLGASYELSRKFTLSGNLAHCFMADRTITASQQRQQAAYPNFPLTSPQPAVTVIGDGTYSGSYDFVGLSLLTRF